MGLSSSQARLLNLTSRMHQIEYRAAKLESEKLQMANESRRAYLDYQNAMEFTKIQYKTLNRDASITYVDATYNNLIGRVFDDKMYFLNDMKTGHLYVAPIYKSAYDCSDNTLRGFLATLNDLSTGNNNSYTSITSAEQLKNLSGKSGNFRLDEDIVLDDWEGITNFSGTFDGNGHSITIKGNSGLFALAYNATIKNVSIQADISGENVGGLLSMGRNVKIENCSSTGTITSSKSIAGGLVGVLAGNSSITNSSASCDIYSNYVSPTNGTAGNPDFFDKCGGLVGYIYDGENVVINDCSSVGGSVNSNYWLSGGFIGQTNGSVTINRCTSDNTVVVNANGYGDDYAQEYTDRGNTYTVPHDGSLFVGLVNSGSVSATDCNIYGNVISNGETSYTSNTIKTTNNSSCNLNNCYSALGDCESSEISFPAVNPSDFPNLDEYEIQNAEMIFSMIDASNGAITISEDNANSRTWLANMIKDGHAILSTCDLKKNYAFDHTSVATDTNLQEVEDNIELRKAEAKYEADMRRIDMKDRKYDYDLAAIEQERNAIKQEMETLKTVAKDNVERTFRLFS